MTEHSSSARPTEARPVDLDGLMQQQAPALPGTASNLATFAWRALLKIKHVPEQLFDVLITPIMFTVMFTFLFGGALAGSPQEYLVFLLPGILAQTVVFTTIYTGVTLNTDISKGIYDRFKSMPIWRASPLVGAMAGDVIRYTGSAVIVFAIGLSAGLSPGRRLPGRGAGHRRCSICSPSAAAGCSPPWGC